MTGKTLNVVMKEQVFVPLGMTSSSYTWQERFEKRKAMGHDASGAPEHLKRPPEANAAASLQTTVLDYARFLAAVLDGKGLTKKTWTEMLRPQIFVDEACLNCVSNKPSGKLSKEIAWGLGWGIQLTADGKSIWHWGDNGDFHAYVLGLSGATLGPRRLHERRGRARRSFRTSSPLRSAARSPRSR